MNDKVNRSVKIALRSNRYFERVFKTIGIGVQEAGTLDEIYKGVMREISQIIFYSPSLTKPQKILELRQTLERFRYNILYSFADPHFGRSWRYGNVIAEEMMDIYQDEPAGDIDFDILTVGTAIDVLAGKLDLQIRLTIAYFIANMPDAMIFGDDKRRGSLFPTDLYATMAFWLITLFMNGFDLTVNSSKLQLNYRKLAIAAMDKRTTDCCLRVHGQVRPLNQDFVLTGTPRFANKMPHPPFHWYCRTVEALILEEFTDIPRLLQEEARQILRNK